METQYNNKIYGKVAFVNNPLELSEDNNKKTDEEGKFSKLMSI